jgi:hypothetical protein
MKRQLSEMARFLEMQTDLRHFQSPRQIGFFPGHIFLLEIRSTKHRVKFAMGTNSMTSWI